MKPLSEKNFIRKEGPWGPSLRPFLISLLIFFSLFLVLIGVIHSYQKYWKATENSRPFLKVTNREFSLFLWHFPGFMRVYAKQKSAYLPGFRYIETQTVDPVQAERIVVAPPEILFLYHTWKRLLSFYYIPTSIPSNEFIEFLESDTQWQPQYWPEASQDYKEWFDSLKEGKKTTTDLSTLSMHTLPLIVRQAFQGWKNYYKQGEAINDITPDIGSIRDFLQKYPHYARNYWVMIGEVEGVPVAGPGYLMDLEEHHPESQIIPMNQLSGFLKVAFYNSLFTP